ncbi:hypothetical protein [Parashewanella tropica]|uniref:hypothetical protein n=1 Tax=Parashewanella tropica TaxID=2547970 RepID=UPI00105A9876|nr:hypothetical protein [Parashewanella tropica]
MSVPVSQPLLSLHSDVTQYSPSHKPFIFDPRRSSLQRFQSTPAFVDFSRNYKEDINALETLCSAVLDHHQASLINNYLMQLTTELLDCRSFSDNEALQLAYTDLRHNFRVLLNHLQANKTFQAYVLQTLFFTEFEPTLCHIQELNQSIVDIIPQLPIQTDPRPTTSTSPALISSHSSSDMGTLTEESSQSSASSLQPSPKPTQLKHRHRKPPKHNNQPVPEVKQSATKAQSKTEPQTAIIHTLKAELDELKQSDDIKSYNKKWVPNIFLDASDNGLSEHLSQQLALSTKFTHRLMVYASGFIEQFDKADQQIVRSRLRLCLAEISISSSLTTPQKMLLTLMALPSQLSCCEDWLLSTATVHRLSTHNLSASLLIQSQPLVTPNRQNLKEWAFILNRDWVFAERVPPKSSPKTKQSNPLMEVSPVLDSAIVAQKFTLGQFRRSVLYIADDLFYQDSRLRQELSVLFQSPIYQLVPQENASEKKQKSYKLIQQIYPSFNVNPFELTSNAQRLQLQLAIVALLPGTLSDKQCFTQLKQVKHLLTQSFDTLTGQYRLLTGQSQDLPAHLLASKLGNDDVAQRLKPHICQRVFQTCTLV